MANESGIVAAKLGTVNIESDIAGTKLNFPVDLELSLKTSLEGAEVGILASIGLSSLQSSFDAIVKSLPMPNDTSGYGTKIVAWVENASLRASGDTALLDANINVKVWQIEKGVPGGGATVRWETRCQDLPWPIGRVCLDVPVSIEMPPGDDIKIELLTEGVNGTVNLSLATPDGTTIEMRPSAANVTPRSDIGKFLNSVAGIFDQNLSALAQKEIAEIVNDGTLRQALPPQILAFNPLISSVQFTTRSDGSLGAAVKFQAILTSTQLTEWLKSSVGKETTVTV